MRELNYVLFIFSLLVIVNLAIIYPGYDLVTVHTYVHKSIQWIIKLLNVNIVKNSEEIKNDFLLFTTYLMFSNDFYFESIKLLSLD